MLYAMIIYFKIHITKVSNATLAVLPKLGSTIFSISDIPKETIAPYCFILSTISLLRNTFIVNQSKIEYYDDLSYKCMK